MSIENIFFNALNRYREEHRRHLLEIKELLKFQQISNEIAQVRGELLKIKQEIIKMAGELDALAAEVQANTDAEQSAVTLLGQLHDLLVAAGTDPTKLADLTKQLSDSKDKLAAAIVANTPSA